MICLDTIPADLKSLPRWCLHRVEAPKKPGGKPQKVPYRASGAGHASSTDPKTWTSFANVVNVPKDFDGISFALAAGDGFVCIDLDGCRNPETGQVEQWAQAILDEVNSYTDISPSGTGFHVWVKATIPRNVKSGQIEIYHDKKIMACGKWDGTFGREAIESRDISKLFEKIASGSHQTKQTETGKGSSTPGKDSSPSVEDYRMIAEVQRRAQCKDVASLLAVFEQAYPGRIAARNAEKGQRNDKPYFTEQIANYLKKYPPTPTTEVPDIPIAKAQPQPDFPQECLIEPLTSILAASPLPPALLYGALVTMFGSFAGTRLTCGIPPFQLSGRLYFAMISPAAGCKGLVFSLAKALLTGTGEYQGPEVHNAGSDALPYDKGAEYRARLFEADGIGSGEALVELLADKGGHACLVWDELSAMFAKCAIEGSTLPGKLCSAYYQRHLDARRARSKHSGTSEVSDAWVSVLGGVQPRKLLTIRFDSVGNGLISRFQWAMETTPKRVDPLEIDTPKLVKLAGPIRTRLDDLRTPAFTGDAKSAFKEWEGTLPDFGESQERLVENTERLALVLSAMRGTDLDQQAARAAIAWAGYQQAIREWLSLVDTETLDAACEQAIFRHLPVGHKMKWSGKGGLYDAANLARYGEGMASRVRSALVSAGRLHYEKPWVWRFE